MLWNKIIYEFLFGYYPLGTHKWDNLVNKADLVSLMEENGFIAVAETGTTINPVTKVMRETKRARSSLMMLFRKLTDEEFENKKRCEKIAAEAKA